MSRNFWILTVGETLNNLGSNFGRLAQAVLVYNLTGSKLAMGTILLLSMGTETLLRLLGSPVVDRFNRVRLMRLLLLLQTVIYAVPPVLASLGLLQVFHLYLFALAAGLAGALYAPTYFAFVPSVVQPEALVRANSISQSLSSLAGLLGPALAGLVIAALGPVPALTLDAISYSVAALGLFLIPVALGQMTQRPAATGDSYLSQLTAGIRYYRSVPMLVLALAGATVINFSFAAGNTMLVPLVREQLGLDVAAVGLLSSAFSAGVLLGGVIMGWIGEVKNRVRGMMVPMVVAGLAMMAFVLAGRGQLILAMAAWGSVGISVGLYIPQSAALYQRLVPDELRGRVMSVRLTISWGAIPLGAAFGSMVAAWAGLPAMFISFGLLPLVLGTLALSLSARLQAKTDPAPAPLRPAV